MALIVQKYGGSSVADAESIKRVAKRIVDTRRAGHEVVVAVSAMGDTTDELLDLAGLRPDDLLAELRPMRLDYGAIEGSERLRRAIAAPESAPADTDSRLRSAG